MLFRSCLAGTPAQEVIFHIEEGPPVELAAVAFEGNAHFDDERLRRELLGFLGEHNARETLFQPLHTGTVDRLGLSDHRPERMPGAGRATAPVSDPERIYVPEMFAEATEHLAGLYRERGFLEVRVEDTCRVAERERERLLGMTFTPLAVRRGEEEATEDSPTPCVFVSEDRRQLLAVIRVDEGPQTSIGELLVEGNTALSSGQLLAAAGVAVDQPYNEFRLREAAREMEALYADGGDDTPGGHLFAEVSFRRSFSPDRRSARVVFRVEEGPRVRVGRVIVRGNEATSSRLIRERLRLEPGDLVTPAALGESEQRLLELGIFDGATVQVAAPDRPAPRKNVIVQVSEGKPQYLEGRVGLATVEGARLGLEYGYRNLAGWAITGRLRVRGNLRLVFLGDSDAQQAFERRYYDMPLLDRLERHLLAGFDTDHFPGTRGILGGGVDAVNERVNVPAFSADRTSGYLRLSSRYLRWLRVDARTGVEMSDITLTPVASELLTNPAFTRWARIPEGESTFWVSGLTLTLDLRDDVFNPSRGVFFSVAGDLVRSLANFDKKPVYDEDGEPTGEFIDRVSNLVRTQATLSGYIPFVGTEVVLALSASAGTIFHLQADSTTWPDRYFYMGGVGTLRGFTEESLIPEDVYQDWKSRLDAYSDEADRLLESPGGESMLLVRSEFRYPLAEGFYGAGFLEGGNIWRERSNLEVDPRVLRWVAGGGIRYMTPLGPIAFDLGINLDKRPHEDRFAWSFSIGSAF